MGVKGLWKLLLPIGRRISLETLEGKILAIDASIWLTQFVKAMRDPQTGQSQPAAHLIGFIRRLCRLYFHGIRPVLVFDGATPEIKQREIQNRRRRRDQFAQTSNEATAKRMAKRILAQNLRKLQAAKTKRTTKATRQGFAPNFNPGGQSATLPSDASNKPSGDNDAMQSSRGSERHQQASAEDEAAILAAIREDIEAAEDAETKAASATNDWDDVVIVDETDKKEKASGDPESDVEYEDFGLKRRKNRFQFQTNINVDYIASLPSKDRKDAIEEAKRRQRMQSRREFMPAAGNPDKFSSVQLQNFLKSSRLNLDIQKMAKEEAKQMNAHGGDMMASDLSTRISLIREETQKEESSDDSMEDDPLFHKSRSKRRKLLHLSQKDSSDDEDFLEEGKEPKSGTAVPQTGKRRVIADDDSVETGFGENSGREEDSINKQKDEEYASAGGFLLPAQRSQEAKQSQPSSRSNVHQFSPNTTEDDVINIEDDSSSEKSNHGAFQHDRQDKIVLDESKMTENNREARKSKEFSATGPPDTSRDAVLAQEMADAFLAEALLDTEQQQMELASQRKTQKPSRDSLVDVSLEESIQQDEDEPETLNLQEKERPSTATSDSSDDEVDWEEGDETSNAETESNNGDPPVKGNGRENDFQITETVRAAETAVRAAQTTTAIDLTTTMNTKGGKNKLKSSAGENGKKSEGAEKVDWIDGDKDVETTEWEQESALPKHDSTEHETNHRVDAETVFDSSPYFKGDSTGRSNDPTLEVSTAEADPNSSAAAIARAEATASNLAGWAGRAFRRAMKESGQYPVADLGSDRSQPALVGKEAPAALASTGQSVSPPPAGPVLTGVHRQSNSTQKSPPKAGLSAVALHSQPDANTDRASTAAILEQYEAEWAEERNRSERDMDTVSDEMKEEAMLLLRLFGVPYVESPAEAEAQCAALEQLGLVDGIVTEDSDVFVFGGKKVYKNIFDERLYAEAYMSEDAEREMSLSRNAMVALAMLLGSDYTEGVKGVGIVNAMEILRAFDVSGNLKEGLQSFRTWLDGFDPSDVGLQDSGEDADTPQRLFHVKHRTARSRWAAPEHFPADNLISAYTNPVVDKSPDKFSWGTPDVEGLVLFCSKHIGWPEEQTRKMLEPVVQRSQSSNRYRQTRLDSFMRYEDGIKFADVKSKRLRAVLGLRDDSSESKT